MPASKSHVAALIAALREGLAKAERIEDGAQQLAFLRGLISGAAQADAMVQQMGWDKDSPCVPPADSP